MSSSVIWWWTWQAPSHANTLPTSPCRSPSRMQRLDPLPVLLGVELVRLGRRQVHALGLERHLVGQVLIGDEQDVGLPQSLGDLRRVRAGAAGVRQRLHVGVGVHVRHGREVAPGARRNSCRSATSSASTSASEQSASQVRQVDRPLGRQRVAALRHEPHAAEHDQSARRCPGPSPPARRVADESAIAWTSGT